MKFKQPWNIFMKIYIILQNWILTKIKIIKEILNKNSTTLKTGY